ncbi:MAG: hypothetical protein QF541_07560 [Lentisphaeria bacterium]|jgi:hypothetical protein|nr:hypothetical protein [Lentisphaeria bacterium]
MSCPVIAKNAEAADKEDKARIGRLPASRETFAGPGLQQPLVSLQQTGCSTTVKNECPRKTGTKSQPGNP